MVSASLKRLTVLSRHVSTSAAPLSPSGALLPLSTSVQSDIGQAAERFVQKLVGGEFQKTFDTSLGGRRIDVFNPPTLTAFESKVGKVSGKHAFKQLEKDLELLLTGKVKRVEWHFFLNKKGQGGMSKPFGERFQKALEESGGMLKKIEHNHTAEEHATKCGACKRSSAEPNHMEFNMGRLGALGGTSGTTGAAVVAVAYEMLCKYLKHEVSMAERMGLTVGGLFAPILGAAAGKTMVGVSANVIISKLAAFSAGFVAGAAVTTAGGILGLLIHKVRHARLALQQTREEIAKFNEMMEGALRDLKADIKKAEETLHLATEDLNDIEAAIKGRRWWRWWQKSGPKEETMLFLKTCFWSEALESLTGQLVQCGKKANSLAQENRDKAVEYANKAYAAASAACNWKDGRDLSTGMAAGTGLFGALLAPFSFGASLALTGIAAAGAGTAVACEDARGNHELRKSILERARDDARRFASEATTLADRAKASLARCEQLHEKSKNLEDQLLSKL